MTLNNDWEEEFDKSIDAWIDESDDDSIVPTVKNFIRSLLKQQINDALERVAFKFDELSETPYGVTMKDAASIIRKHKEL